MERAIATTVNIIVNKPMSFAAAASAAIASNSRGSIM
jgi:hypothetical protein